MFTCVYPFRMHITPDWSRHEMQLDSFAVCFNPSRIP